MFHRSMVFGFGLVVAMAGTAGAQVSPGDMNCDGAVNGLDIAPFVDCLLTGNCPSCPPAGMVLIPASEFEMGDPWSEGDSDELPVHTVYLSSYHIDTYEVTSQQYADGLNWARAQGGLIAVDNGVVFKYGNGTSYPYCETTISSSDSRITWDGCTFGAVFGKEDHPMERVSWFGAVAFCNWRSGMQGWPLCYDLSNWTCNFSLSGYRLPTEAEWEKAAGWDPSLQRHFRFGEHTDGCEPFPGCLDGHRANYWISGDPFESGTQPWTTPGGYYDGTTHGGYATQNAQSYYGCHDASGNVWEWCHDWYDTYPSTPQTNPIGPESGTHRVLRGGGWYSNVTNCRAASRTSYLQGSLDNDHGFRCAMGTP